MCGENLKGGKNRILMRSECALVHFVRALEIACSVLSCCVLVMKIACLVAIIV